MVSFIAAGIVMGHVLPHWLASRFHRPQPPPPQELVVAAPATPDAPLVVPICQLQPPLNEADELVRRFETCGVGVREFHNDVLVMTPVDGWWTGARFRKTAHGWIALQMDGGDIN